MDPTPRLRPLGRTGLQVSPLGLGLAALGRPGYLNLGHADDLGEDRSVDALRARAWEVLDAAWAQGVRAFDAARSYGRAEEFLAGWLAARDLDRAPGGSQGGSGPSADVVVSSKWGYTYTAGWRPDAEVHEVKDHSLAQLRRQVAESRDLLGPHLDVYQIHSATLESGVLDDAEVLAELAALAADGLVVGLSVSGPRQAEVIRRALQVQAEGRCPFAVVQATWNVLEPSAGAALAEAAAAGWGVIVKEGVANGRLTGRGDAAAAPPLARLAAAHDVGVDAVALAAALAQPWASMVLSGAATVAQLRSNLAAADVDLDAGALDELAGLAEEPGDYWAARAALPWT